MLEGEEEHETVSEEDFSLNSVDSQGNKRPEITIADLLRNKALQEKIQAELELKKKAVPDRIKLISDESKKPLRDMLKALWKDKCRILTVNHMLADSDCSGDQAVEEKMLAEFEDAQLKFQKAEQARKEANIARLKEIRAAKRLEQMGSEYSGSDEADSEVDSNDYSDSASNASDRESEVPSTSRGSENTRGSKASGKEVELEPEEGGGESKEGAEREDDGERDSDDDMEPPPELVPITLAFVNNILHGKQKIEGVQFDDNPLGPQGLTALSKTLTTCPRLTMLNLSSVQAGAEGATGLADALRSSSLQRTMEHLIFGFNNIGPDGCAVIAEAVGRRCGKIETLRLHSNNIKSTGATSLAKELFSHKRLSVLDIGDNSIGDRGCEVLSEYMVENRSLRRLNLNNNLFTVRGASALRRSLVELRSVPKQERLQRLSIMRCRRLTRSGAKEIKEAADCLEDFYLFSDKK